VHGVLIFHIAAGTLAVLSGVAALVFRKGGRMHRGSGIVFMFAMAAMGVTAAIVGADEPSNAVAGGLVLYFVATAWLTVKRRDGRSFEIIAFVLATSVAAMGFWSAYLIATGAREAANPYILYASLFVNSAIALAALGDLSVAIRGRIAGAQRIARHLWRMCFALFIAVGSFSAQGVDALPASIPGPQILLASILIVLSTMIYWLARVLFTKWATTASVSA
jgi:hypothetical protein